MRYDDKVCYKVVDNTNQHYYALLEEESDGPYIQDIMRGGIRNDDPRIPRKYT